MRIVLDVNILASASTFPARVPGTVLSHGLSGQFELILSDPILERLAVVLTRPYFVETLPEPNRIRFLESLENIEARTVPDLTVRGIAPDLEDDLVLGTAVAANADFLVTGDKGLLAVGEYRGVKIVTAVEFLEYLTGA